MLPYGLQFGVFVITMVITIKFGFLYGVGAYVLYRLFLKD